MPEPTLGIHTIGQTPRPDLTEGLALRFPGAVLHLRGALDGLDRGAIPDPAPDGYPLETRLGDGTRVVVDAAFLAPRLQRGIEALDPSVDAHLVLCAGPFPGLSARKPLVLPFEAGSAELAARGFGRLEVVVPFAAQAEPAREKWTRAGFSCRAHTLGERWEEGEPEAGGAALVFDYVGMPHDVLVRAAARAGLPAFDLGALALDALERTLERP